MGKQTKRSDVALFLFLKNCKAGWKKNSGKLELQQHHLHLGEFVEAEERLRQRVSGNSLWAQPSEQASLKSWCTYGSHGIGIGRRGGKGQGQRCFFLYDGFSQEAEDYTKTPRVLGRGNGVRFPGKPERHQHPTSQREGCSCVVAGAALTSHWSEFYLESLPRMERVLCLWLKYTSGIFV